MFLQRAKDPTHYSQCKCESHKEEKDMKFAKLPLPTNDGGGWTTNVLSTVELITIYNQVKNEQIDGIMIVDSHDYGGQYEQRAIVTVTISSTGILTYQYHSLE